MPNDNLHDEIITQAKTQGMSFDMRFLWIRYRKRLIIILPLTIVCMILAVVWVKMNVSPLWKARSIMIMAPKNMSTPAELPYLYQSFDIHTVLETVRLRDVLVDVISKLDLDTTPEELYKAVDVQRGNRSSVLFFTVRWPDRIMAAKIANETANAFIANNTKLMNSSTQKLYRYYLTEKQNRMQAIQNLEPEKAAFQNEHGVISISQESQNKFEELKEVEVEMIKNQLKLTEMDSKILEMQDKLKTAPSNSKLTWTYSETDQRKLLDLQRELENLRARYSDDNPKVQKVLEDIRILQNKMNDDDRNLPSAETWGPSGLIDVYTIDKSRYEADKLACFKMDREYRTKIDSIRTSLLNLSDIEMEYMELERQIQLNRDILRIVEARLAEAQMSIQSNVSDYEIIEKAKPPIYPEGSNRKLIVLVVGAVIFFLSSCVVVGKDILNKQVRSVKDFEATGVISCLGQLPITSQMNPKTFSKIIQMLGGDLLRIINSKQHTILSIGSDVPESGKTFLINELIKLFSNNRKKILVIETVKDIDSHEMQFVLNEFLYGHSDSLLTEQGTDSVSHMYFILEDRTFEHLLESNRIQALYSALNNFDLIIWELCAFQENPQLFASIAMETDILVLVGRFFHSTREKLAECVRLLKERQFSNIYGVMNYVHKDYYPKNN